MSKLISLIIIISFISFESKAKELIKRTYYPIDIILIIL